MKNSYKLLTILQDYAPTGNEQQRVSNSYNELVMNEKDENIVVKNLAGWLYDGLAFGNWPWSF